jgi:hypothetical protein
MRDIQKSNLVYFHGNLPKTRLWASTCCSEIAVLRSAGARGDVTVFVLGIESLPFTKGDCFLVAAGERGEAMFAGLIERCWLETELAEATVGLTL